MKRAAVYIRMSTDDQADSPQRQRDQVLPYCEKKGYRVVEVYEDAGMRGWDNDRPAFQRLLRDAQKGLFDIIVVDEASRLSRQDPIEYVVTVAHPLRQAGVAVEVVDEGRQMNWDGGSSSGSSASTRRPRSRPPWAGGRRPAWPGRRRTASCSSAGRLTATGTGRTMTATASGWSRTWSTP